MTIMHHEGYIASIELGEDAGLFHGEVINTRDVLTFQGRAFAELQSAFADTIADYRDWCQERGKEPERPYSGPLTSFAVATPLTLPSPPVKRVERGR